MRGDSLTQYQAVMDVLDVIGRLGIYAGRSGDKAAGQMSEDRPDFDDEPEQPPQNFFKRFRIAIIVTGVVLAGIIAGRETGFERRWIVEARFHHHWLAWRLRHPAARNDATASAAARKSRKLSSR